jgi:O-antigen/teichoic acid export membrane protein
MRAVTDTDRTRITSQDPSSQRGGPIESGVPSEDGRVAGARRRRESRRDQGGASDLVRVSRGAAASLISTGVGVIRGVIITILLTRGLGVSRYGSLALAVAAVSIVQAFTSFGLSTGAARMISLARAERGEERALRLLKASVLAGVATGLLGTAGAFLLGWTGVIEGIGTSTALMIMAPLVIATGLRSAVYGGLRAFQDLRAIFTLGVTVPILDVIVVGSLFIAGERDIVWYAAGLVVVAYLELVMAVVYLRRGRTLGPLTDTTWVDIKALVFFSLPLVVTQLMFFAIQRTDVLVLGWFGTPEDVGLYAPVMRFSSLATKFLTAFPLLYVPIATTYVAVNGLDKLRELFVSVTKWAYLLGFTIILALVVAPGQILAFLFGEPYSHVETVARILAVGYWASLVAGLNGATLGALGAVKRMAVWSTAGMLVNLAVEFALIPPFGPAGAAWSNTISYVFVNVAYGVLLYRVAHISPFRRDATALFLYSIVLAVGGAMLTQIPALSDTLPAFAVVGGVGLLWLIGALVVRPFRMEWREMKGIIRSRGRGRDRGQGQDVPLPVEPGPDLDA